MFLLHHPSEHAAWQILSPASPDAYSLTEYEAISPHGTKTYGNCHTHLTSNGIIPCVPGPKADFGGAVRVTGMLLHNNGDEPLIAKLLLFTVAPVYGMGPPAPAAVNAEYVPAVRFTLAPQASKTWSEGGGWERALAETGETGPPDDAGIPLLWGAMNVGASADIRYLAPGYMDALAEPEPLSTIIPRSGMLGRIYVRHNAAVGNGNPVEYIVRVNDLDTDLRVTLATGALGSAMFEHEVPVAKGDRIDLKAVKALGIGTGTVEAVVTVLLYPPIPLIAIKGDQGDPGPQGDSATPFIARMIGAGSTPMIVPAGITALYATGAAGGGGGGGGASNGTQGFPGGGGAGGAAAVDLLLTVVPGETLTIVRGTGGVGGAGGSGGGPGSSGTGGGATTITGSVSGPLLTLYGGGFGSGAVIGNGGAGGVPPSPFDSAQFGGAGSVGVGLGVGTSARGGNGGGNIAGGFGGQPEVYGGVGRPGKMGGGGSGGGGSGPGTNGQSGGAGGAGFMILRG